MKKANLLTALLLTVGTFSAQTNNNTQSNRNSDNNAYNNQGPPTVTNRFNTDYPDADETWSRDGSNYRADYNTGTMGHSIIYDANGRVIRTDEQLANGSYPSGISDYYTKNYPSEQYDVWSSTDANGNQTYYINRNSETYWFDKSGKYQKKSKSKTASPTSKSKPKSQSAQ